MVPGYDLSGVTQENAYIGSNWGYANPTDQLQKFTNGWVDDVAVFDGALTSTQIGLLASGEGTPLNLPAPALALKVDRDTGGITLSNTSGEDIAIYGYKITSKFGALDQAGWTTVKGHYDVAGDHSIDDDDNWTILTGNGIHTDLSEVEFDGGNGGTLHDAQPISLGASAWIQCTVEDLKCQLLLADGTVQDLDVIYTGNDGSQFCARTSILTATSTSRTGLTTSAAWRPTSPVCLRPKPTKWAISTSTASTAAWTSSSSRPTLMPPTAPAFDAMLAGMQVPEPSSMLMLGLAGMALLGSGTRRRTLPRIWMNSTNFLQKWAVVTAMALVVTGSVRTANAVGLLGYWSLDDNLLDQSPFGNNGTLVNNAGDNSGSTTGGPEFDSDVPAAIGSGKSIGFDGLDDAVNLGNNHGTQTMGISGATTSPPMTGRSPVGSRPTLMAPGSSLPTARTARQPQRPQSSRRNSHQSLARGYQFNLRSPHRGRGRRRRNAARSRRR